MRVPLLFFASLLGLASTAYTQVISGNSPEAIFVNQQYNLGLAAGNSDDWYLNCDLNHEKYPEGEFLQMNRYPDESAFGMQRLARDTPRTVLGNASLGIGGLWGMTRYYTMNVISGNVLYTQYRANQHYFYPAVRDVSSVYDRDYTYALAPYCTQTVGASHSERDEVRKFFLGLAALRPDVKTILKDNGMLIPTLQMTHQRTRVASDAEYLTGLAHPSAFATVNNDYDMVVMTNGITAETIPPLVQMSVVEENFLGTHPSQFNERTTNSTGEWVFTTPCAIGRLWRGPEYTKRMVVDVSGSIDLNDLDLTYSFVVLRGDASKVRFTPLNAEGSLMEIEMDYYSSFIDPNTGELSNMLLIGVFANNGYYYSAPAYITCSTLWNEIRSYGSDHVLDTIAYSNKEISFEVAYERSWNKDHFSFDPYGRVFKYLREYSTSIDAYSPDGYLVLEEDADGRPTKVTSVSYSNSNAVTTVAPDYDSVNYLYDINCDYFSAAIDANSNYTFNGDHNSDSFTKLIEPVHGSVEIQSSSGVPPKVVYTPAVGFTGVDIFSVIESNYTLQEQVLRRFRVVVGPADTEPPQQTTGVQVIPKSIDIARIFWELPYDNYEVAYFNVYRDGQLHGRAYGLEYEDEDVTPGTTYDYTIVAVDDADNASTPSVATNGGGAAIWGQDNFDDNKIAVADATLQNCLTWNLISGNVQANTQNLRPGHVSTVASYVVTNQSITPPFTLDFSNYQRYCTNDNGPILLYQDADNFYHFRLNRDYCELYRRMDGIDTLIGSDVNLRMQIHTGSTARYQITVVAVDGVITFQIIRREWTNSPDSVAEAFFFDADVDAFARFTGGPIGFKQLTLGSYSGAVYDDLYLSRLDGQGPDIDGDGLIDAWERVFFGDYTAEEARPDSDPDHDGISTANERLWGSNPVSGESSFKFDLAPGTSGDLSLSWPSLRGRVYTVWQSFDLVNWLEAPGMIDITSTPPRNLVELDLQSHAAGFFQIEVKEAP